MNEEALKDSYGLFTQSGYSGTQDEFYTLLSDNAEAFADSYGLFKGSGYNGSEDDYKELLGLKKKDSSVLQDAAAPKDSGVSPSVSQDGQSSLEQDVQVSLEERLAKRKNLPIEEQIALAKQDELRPFYESQGLNLDDKLNFEAIKKSKAEKEKKEKESEQDLSFFSKLYNRITSTEDLEEDFQTTDEDRADLYLSNNEENIFEAEKQYNIAKAKEITQVFSPDQRKEQFEEQGIDLGYMPTSFIKVNGEDFSVKELQKNLYDSEFIDKLQSEEVNVDIDNSIEDETLQSLIDLRDRQKESGGQWGDLAQSFYAGALDLLVAGPLEAVETIVMPRGYKEVITNVVGGTLGDKVNKYANKVRENTRVYQEEGMTKSLLKGNWSDAMFQTGNALSESAPLILSMYASAPLKLSQGVTLGFAGVSAGGLKSLELKEQRLKGEIDISDAQILLNSALTGGAEAFFERFTLDAVNASRKVFALGKITPGEIAEGFTKGFLRQARVEGLSEGATELSNMFTDLITRDIDYEKGELKETAISLEDVAVRFSDAAMIGSIMGGGIHTVPYMAKSMSKFKILDENIAVLFTMEDGSTQSMSRADALKFVKNPEVAERVRSSAVTMDASMNDIAKQELEEILYGFYAPDAVASREVMREKEGGVQNILDRIRDAEEVSTEDVNSLSQAVSEMEAEGKKSKYNISESTKATRGKLNAILKQKGIQIVDAVASQDVSMSKVTETVDATKIESQEQYDTVKKQLEDGKRKPTVVQSQNQSGIKVNGETSQTSEITQGKFKSVAAARNAMKDFEVNRDATKKGEVLDSDLFPVNNEIFLKAKKETLDEIPKEVIDNNDYHVLTSDKEGLTQEQRISRMEKLKSMLDKAGATYYTVQDVSNGVAKESLVVTGIDNATALNLGNQFQQESIFSSKDGKMFGDGRVVPLSNDVVKGPDARKKQDVTIMNVGGRKVSMHTGLDKLKTSYGKNFNSDNIHKLDESNADYDAELFQGLDDSRKRALGFAFKLLNSIGGLNVTVVRNSKAMEKQLEAIGQDPSKKRGSFFRGSDKTIYVNLETARGNTLFHEIIHPMVDFIKKTDPALYKRIEAEVKESDVKRRVMKDGRRMKGSYLEWAQSNPAYEGLSEEGLIEEAFAEMMGDAAYGHFVNKQSTLYRIREVIREILSRIGVVSPFENVEAIDLNQMSLSDIRTDLAEALVNGRKINVGGVEFEVGDIQADKDKVDNSIRMQVDKSDVNSELGVVNINIPDNIQTQEIRFQAPEFYPNFDVSKVKRGSIKEFNGQKALLMLTDRSASGMVVSPTGVRHEFDGGVFYPYQEDTGVWAFSDKAAATRMINAARESDGLVFLTAMAPGSIDGSVNMFDYVMKELDQAIKDKRATKKEVVEFLNKKMTIKSFDSKAKDQGIKTSKVKSVKEFSNIVLSMPQAFGVRKDIIRKSIHSKIFEKWGIPSMQEIYNTVNQDIIKDLKGNPIVSAIRIDTEAGYVDSRLDDKIKDHPTYPYVVKGEPLMIFDESVDASEVWDELNLADKFLIDSRTGEKLSEGTTQARRQRKIEMARPVVDIRMQAPQEETESVVYTSGLTTIAFDIAQAVVDADYKAGKYTTKQLAKVGIDKPRKDFGGYDIRLSKLLAKPFGSHSNEEIKEIMVRNRGDLQAELLRVDNNLKLLKNTIKDSDITPEQVNDLLHNVEDIKAMEKSELRTALLEMRTHIDELSRTLVREGLVAGQTMFTIDSNMGLYVTRSYRQFETKNWEQTDNDIIQNAKDFLYREVKNQNIRDVEDGKVDKDGNLITLMSEDAILNKVEEAYDKLVEEKDFLKFSGGSSSLEGLTRVNSIFKQKKVIPEEIRELWGEIDSPLTNYSNTISKVAKTISAERMYRELNNIGQGKFISDNYDRTSTRNKLEGSKWGDLDGKYVDDEMYVVMNQVNRTFEKNGFQKAYDAYMQLVLFNKKMKTVWNPGTHAKNIIGNSSFAMMNGHLSPDLKQIYQDGKLSFQAFKNMKSEEFKELYDKLIRLGVVNSSASLAEIQNISEDLRNTNFDLTEYLKDKNGKIQKRMAKVSGTIKEEVSSFDEKLMKAYQAEDDVWKIFGYLSERGRYIKAGLDVAVAEEMAAKNIRNLYPNYNEIPRIIRFLGRSPLVGSFVAFQAESVRNAKNTVMLGFEEMGSDNSKIRRIGATRIAGTIATMTLMEGLQLYTAQFLGEFLGFGGEDDDDVERRKMRLLLPEWDAPGNISYMFRGFLESKQSEDQTERDRYFDYINFSSISGVGYMKDIMRLAFTDIDTQLGQNSALNILEKIYAPFLGQEMTSIAVTEALTNKGGKVFNQTDWPFKAIGKMIIYVGDKVQPGGGRVLQRGVESLYDEDSDLVPGYEALAIFGIRINRVNVNKGLAIKSNFLFKDMVSRVGKGILKDPFALREEARSNSSFNEDLNKLADLIAAARLNSINGENVKAILSNSRVSRPVIDEAYNRYLDRYLEDAISVDDK